MNEEEYKIDILASAQSEIEEIANIHLVLVGPDSAKRITDRIYRAINLLKVSPEMGIKCKDKLLRLQGYRMLICGNYLCFYRIIGDMVFVCHIADGRSDYPRSLTDLEP